MTHSPKLPSYTAAMQQEQQQHQPDSSQGDQQPQQQPQPQQQQPHYRGSYQHQEPQQQQQQQQRRQQLYGGGTASLRTDGGDVGGGGGGGGTLEINSAFLKSPAGGLLTASSIIGLLLSICGAIPLWSVVNGGSFCVFSGLLHFCGSSFLFFAYLYNFINSMPQYCRALALYYYLVCSGISLVAFVHAASSASLHSAAVASAVFAFLSLGVDVVLIVLNYMALRLDYAAVRSTQDHDGLDA